MYRHQRKSLGDINLSSLSLFTLFAYLLIGCNSYPDYIDVSGQVIYQDQYQNTIAHGGISNVSLVPTSAPGGHYYSTVTDTDGNWRISNVKTADYRIMVTKSGYGTAETGFGIFNSKANNGSIKVWIGQIPTFGVTGLTPYFAKDTLVIIGVVTDRTANTRRVAVYLGKDSTVSNENFSAQIIPLFNEIGGSTDVPPSDSVFKVVWRSLPNEFYSTGSRVYVAAYGCTGVSWIFMVGTQPNIQTDVNAAPARTSIIVP